MEGVTFENVQELLDKNKKPKEVFDYVGVSKNGFSCVELNKKWNFLNEKNWKILSPNQWFDSCWPFQGGFAFVLLHGRRIFIDENGNICYNDKNKEPLGESVDDYNCIAIPKELYNRLDYLGLIPNETRSNNVGKSDYSKHTIQPWSAWLDYNLNPWDADILKRILRTKEEPGMSEIEARIMDYEKIIHIAKERIRQLEIEK